MTKTNELTINEANAVRALIKSCLAGMGGKVRADLDDDPYTWVAVEDLVDAGWNKNSAQGTFASLVDRGIIGEMDKNEWAIDHGHPMVIEACDSAPAEATEEEEAAPLAEKPNCATMKAIAASFEGPRKDFLAQMEAAGAKRGTASRCWQMGRN